MLRDHHGPARRRGGKNYAVNDTLSRPAKDSAATGSGLS